MFAVVGGCALLRDDASSRLTPAPGARPVLRGHAAPGNAWDHYRAALDQRAEGADAGAVLQEIRRGAQCGVAAEPPRVRADGSVWLGVLDVLAYGEMVDEAIEYALGRCATSRECWLGATRSSSIIRLAVASKCAWSRTAWWWWGAARVRIPWSCRWRGEPDRQLGCRSLTQCGRTPARSRVTRAARRPGRWARLVV
ncbi:MAG: hypothetical protein AAF628_18625 [Planctomycetota bacterium]